MDIGDTVKFVTGDGPVMTVVRIFSGSVHKRYKGTGNVLCKWWDEKEEQFKEYCFDMKELEP